MCYNGFVESEHGVVCASAGNMALRHLVPKTPPRSPVPPRSPIHKPRHLPTHSESTLPQMLIPPDFNSFIGKAYRKRGEGPRLQAPKFSNSPPCSVRATPSRICHPEQGDPTFGPCRKESASPAFLSASATVSARLLPTRPSATPPKRSTPLPANPFISNVYRKRGEPGRQRATFFFAPTSTFNSQLPRPSDTVGWVRRHTSTQPPISIFVFRVVYCTSATLPPMKVTFMSL